MLRCFERQDSRCLIGETFKVSSFFINLSFSCFSFDFDTVPWLSSGLPILPERGSSSKGSSDADLCRAKRSTCRQPGHLASSFRPLIQLETREGAARLRCHSEAELWTLASNHPGKNHLSLYNPITSHAIIFTFPPHLLFLPHHSTIKPIEKEKKKIHGNQKIKEEKTLDVFCSRSFALFLIRFSFLTSHAHSALVCWLRSRRRKKRIGGYRESLLGECRSAVREVNDHLTARPSPVYI